MIYKNSDFDANINNETVELKKGSTNFYSEDKGTAQIRVYVKLNGKPLNLTTNNLTPQLDLFLEDGSIFKDEPLEIVHASNGLIQYKISDDVIKHVGRVDCKLFLNGEDKKVHVANFSFGIKDSGVEGAVQKEISVNLVEDTVRNIIEENAIELLGEGFKTEVLEGFQDYVTENVEQFKGEKGDTGNTGDKGVKGDKGDKGDTGEQGSQGAQGVRGPQGLKGDKGDKGEQGIQGIPGVDGVDGQDADMTAIDEMGNKLERIYGLSDKSLQIYVSNTTGSINGDGTIGNKFLTVQQAFDSIPKVIDKRCTVYIDPGEYDEDAYLLGVIGGAIYVRSTPTEKPDVSVGTDVRIGSLNFYDIVGYVHLEDMSPMGVTPKKGFILFSRVMYGSVSRCRIDRYIGDIPALYWDGSYGSFGTSYVSNQFLIAKSMNGSTVRVEHSIISGGNNTTSLYSENGFIFKRGDTTAWVDDSVTPEVLLNGGKIYEDSVWTTVPLKNGWTINSGLILRVKKVNEDFAFLYGWVNKQPMDTTVIATIPSKFKPLHTQRSVVAATGTSSTQDANPILDIKLNGDVVLVNTGTLPTNNGIAINIMYPLR